MNEGIKYKDFDGWDVDESSARLLIAITKHEELDGLEILNEYDLTAGDDGELQNYMYVESIEEMNIEEKKLGYDVLSNNLESFDQLNAVLERFNFRHLWHLNEGKLNFVSEGEWEDDRRSIENLISVCDRFIICEVCAISDYDEDSSSEEEDDLEYDEE